MIETNNSALPLQIVCHLTILFGFLSLIHHQKFSKQSPVLVNLATETTASMMAFVPLFLASALSFWTQNSATKAFIIAAGVLAVVIQAKWQPCEASFLSHRRHRLLGFVILFSASILIFLLIDPNSTAAIPLLFAIVIYGRHILFFQKSVSSLISDMDGMTQKNLKLESNFSTLAMVQQSRDDKFSSAS